MAPLHRFDFGEGFPPTRRAHLPVDAPERIDHLLHVRLQLLPDPYFGLQLRLGNDVGQVPLLVPVHHAPIPEAELRRHLANTASMEQG
jgi:hypothetical protein